MQRNPIDRRISRVKRELHATPTRCAKHAMLLDQLEKLEAQRAAEFGQQQVAA